MSFWEFIKVVIIGIIEGITEWLPISSTGHIILAEDVLKLTASKDFLAMFNVVIQLGAILAVVVLYFNKLNPIDPRKSKREKADIMQLWYKVIISCLPAGVIGVLVEKVFDIDLDQLPVSVVAATLIIYGILFIVVEYWHKGKKPRVTELNRLSYKTAFLIGMFQVLALIPGTSRSGATILGGLILGTSRFVATEFTFFLAIPVMFGASLIKIIDFGVYFSTAEIVALASGTLVSFVVSIIAIKFLLQYIKNHSFTFFGVYRIVLGALVLVYFFIIK
jgi:undecaprenyl-diphosphatase